MKTINSHAVKNEVFNMQANEVSTSTNARKLNKGTLLFIAYLTAVGVVLGVLNYFNLIPA